MKEVIFYLLKDNEIHDGLNSVERLLCDIVTKFWRNGKCILIICENKKQAIQIDEALWVRPSVAFIPHNLSGEGPKKGSPVEIIWNKEYNNNIYDILINLCVRFDDFITTFTKVVDFAPCEESLKKLARERYKAYRIAGFDLKMVT